MHPYFWKTHKHLVQAWGTDASGTRVGERWVVDCSQQPSCLKLGLGVAMQPSQHGKYKRNVFF